MSDTHIEGLEEIGQRIHEAIYGNRVPRDKNFPVFLRDLLADPAILAHIPAYKALQEEVERLERSLNDETETSMRLSSEVVPLRMIAEQRRDRIAALESQLAALQAGGEFVAYCHVLTDDSGNDRYRFTVTPDNPYGVAGEDYSKDFTYKSYPLYTQAPASVQPVIAWKQVVIGDSPETAGFNEWWYEQEGFALRCERASTPFDGALMAWKHLKLTTPTSAIPPGYAVVPEEMEPPIDTLDPNDDALAERYVAGWNGCRKAMLASAPLSSAPIAEQGAKDAARDLLSAIVDIWDDGRLEYEHRVYAPGAFNQIIDEAKAMLATPADSSEGKK